MVPCWPPLLNMQSWILTQKSWLPFFKQINLYLLWQWHGHAKTFADVRCQRTTFRSKFFSFYHVGPGNWTRVLPGLVVNAFTHRAFSPIHYFLPLLHSLSHACYWDLQLAWPITFSQTLPKLSASFLLSLFLSSLINKTRNPKGIPSDSLLTLAFWAKGLAHRT